MSIVSDFIERVRMLVFRGREERELDEELRFHVEMEERARRHAGESPGDARRHSYIALGGVERTKDDVRDARGTRWLGDISGDVAFAVRSLVRAPGFAIIAIVTLAVGIGGTTAVFSAVDAVLLRPLPYAEPGQLVRLYQRDVTERSAHGFVTPVHYAAYHDRMTSFAASAALGVYSEKGGDLVTPSGVERVRMLSVGADYLSVLRVAPEIGRGFERADEDNPSVVLISHALWTEQFAADPSAAGRTLVIDGKPYVVRGVMPAGFNDPVVPGVQVWLPIDGAPARDASNASNHYLGVIARLRPGVSIAAAQAELDVLSRRLANEYPRARRVRADLFPLKDDIVGHSSRALQLTLGAALAVLVLVCVNLANLLLVRASEREREFAVRAALGAERTRLVRQLLAESLVLAIAGDVAAFLVARVAMAAIVQLAGGAIPRLSTLSLDPGVLAFSLGLATASALGFGLWPALRAGASDPNDTLRGESRAGTASRAHGRLRAALVVSQVALAFVLLVSAGMLIASLRNIDETDLGVSASKVLTFELHLPDGRYDSTARARTYEEVARRVEQIAGVRAAGGISKLPATGPFNQWGVELLSGPFAHDADRAHGSVENRVVSGDYFRAVGMHLVAGRFFDARDNATAPMRAVVSKSFADRFYPGVDPIGQRFFTGDDSLEIVGVVNDVALDPEGTPDLYVYHWHVQFAGDRNWALTQVVATTTPPESVMPAVRSAIAEVDPQLVVYHPASLADVIGRGSAQRVFVLRLLTSFSSVALALAALGLFGVLSYSVTLRTREFGIRMALGADSKQIRRSVLGQGLRVTLVGVVVGLAGAIAASKLMASLLFHVSPAEPTVLGGAALFMTIVAGIAAYLPARRATAVNPRTALQ